MADTVPMATAYPEAKATVPQHPLLLKAAETVQAVHAMLPTMQMPLFNASPQQLSELLGLPAVAKTAERIAYGERLTSGRGQTLKIKPETMDAAFAVAPMAAAVTKLPGLAGRAAISMAEGVGQLPRVPMRPFPGVAPSAAAPKVMDATVLHSSPHKFDKLDSSHIGKGEGAQVYGQGLYFTDSPSVHKYYNEQFSRQGPTTKIEFNGEVLDQDYFINAQRKAQDMATKNPAEYPDDPNFFLSDIVDGYGTFGSPAEDVKYALSFQVAQRSKDPVRNVADQLKEKIRRLDSALDNPEAWGMVGGPVKNPEEFNKIHAARDRIMERFQWLRDNRDILKIDKASGAQRYEIDLPDDKIANMLQWNEPFSKQPRAVQDAIKKIAPNFKTSRGDIPTIMLDGTPMWDRDSIKALRLQAARQTGGADDIMNGSSTLGDTDRDVAMLLASMYERNVIDPIEAAKNKIIDHIRVDKQYIIDEGKMMPAREAAKVNEAINRNQQRLDWLNSKDRRLNIGATRVDLSGEDLYRGLTEHLIDENTTVTNKSVKEAEIKLGKLLAERGVVGHRYLANDGSKKAGTGNYNFVVYPGEERHMTILKREDYKKK